MYSTPCIVLDTLVYTLFTPIYTILQLVYTLALLHRARKFLTTSTCITLYNTMVLPLFDNSAVVWDSCGQVGKSYLDKLNRRAACIIEGRAVKSDELSTIFGWPHLQALG